jgi:hypothetical protein
VVVDAHEHRVSARGLDAAASVARRALAEAGSSTFAAIRAFDAVARVAVGVVVTGGARAADTVGVWSCSVGRVFGRIGGKGRVEGDEAVLGNIGKQHLDDVDDVSRIRSGRGVGVTAAHEE